MPKQTTKKTTKKAAVKKTAAKKTVVKKAAVKKVAAKKVAAKKTVVAKKAAPAKKAVVAKKAAPAKKAVKKVAKKAAPKPAAPEPVVTTVIAKVDAGFGNEIFLRGNCSGLTWDQGVLMENASSDEWIWKSTVVTSELEFKVLLNDEVWSVGPNGVVFPGATVVFEPAF